MDLALRREKGRWRVVSKSAVTLNSNTVQEDPQIVAVVADQHATAVEYVNQVVATSVEELSAAQACWRDTAIVDYVQQVQIDEEEVGLALGAPDDMVVPDLLRECPTHRFPSGRYTVHRPN